MTDGRFGGFWRRLLAYGIDQILLNMLCLFLLVIGLIALGAGGTSFTRIVTTGTLPRQAGLFLTLYLLATFLVGMAYSVWFHGSVGQTPGKMILGLRVIGTTGEQIGFGIAFLRWVGTFVSALPFWLGYLWIAFDARKQGWHDKIAATLVVRTAIEPTGALGAAPPTTSGSPAGTTSAAVGAPPLPQQPVPPEGERDRQDPPEGQSRDLGDGDGNRNPGPE